MTITVGIDTYITLDDARAYVQTFGLAPLPTNDTDAEALLKRATISLDRIYGNKYLGQKEYIDQPLAWLRLMSMTPTPHYIGEWPYVTYDSDGNPRDFSNFDSLPELGWAQTELAVLIQAGTDIFAQQAPAITESTYKVEKLEETLKYANKNGYKEDFLYKIATILRPLLRANSAGIPMTRGA